jgi:hypothetical protein
MSREVTGIDPIGFPFAFQENTAVKMTKNIDTSSTHVAFLTLCNICRMKIRNKRSFVKLFIYIAIF